VAHGLYPPLLRQEGLVAAFERVQGRTPVPLTLDSNGVGRYSPEIESAVYYCCLEATQNATKYGGADVQITVVLRDDGNILQFSVADDGPGFSPAPTDGSGLQSMEDRLGAIGGHLHIRSARGGGTTVFGTVPYAGAPA
jgi:signal transduction histidine kinase